MCVVLAVAAIGMLGAAPLEGQGTARGKRYTKDEVQDVIRKLESSTDDFHQQADKKLDRSRMNESRREDNLNEQVKELEAATDRLREKFDKDDDWEKSRDRVGNMLKEARDINDLMGRNKSFDPVRPEWLEVKRHANTLAQIYDLRPLS